MKLTDPSSREKILHAIWTRDVAAIVDIFFEPKTRRLRDGFRHESDLWDYKVSAPGHGRTNATAWAEIAADVLGFHNHEGGILFFGVTDDTFSVCGTGTQLDSKQFNDKLRRYIGDAFWVAYSREFQGSSGLHLGIVIIPKHAFRVQVALNSAETFRANDEPCFAAGDVCVRLGDETKILRGPKAVEFLQNQRLPSTDFRYAVNCPGYRILAPDYRQFVYREYECNEILKALSDRQSFITLLLGFGGLGKTALATWAAIEAYTNKWFDYIVSVSAKDRSLTSGGIQRVEAGFSSFDTLLNSILDVMGFSETKVQAIEQKAKSVSTLLEGEKVLLYVDNLETVDDNRIFQFLEGLPYGIKVLVTSRVANLRRGIFPIDVGPMNPKEINQFFDYCCERKDPDFSANIPPTERDIIFEACGRAPLVVEWFLGNCRTPFEAIDNAHKLKRTSRFGDELIEFCFRRIDNALSPEAKKVLRVISLFVSAMPIEAIAAGADVALGKADEACQELIAAGLVLRDYSKQLRDVVYYLLPITQRFVMQALRTETGLEHSIRRSLSKWYDATDVADSNERLVTSEIRKGVREPELMLVEYADSMRIAGNLADAEKFYTQALQRNPQSWQAYRGLGEVHRLESRIGQALACYEQAAVYSPKRGADRALIFREWGMLLRTEGGPDSLRSAIDKLEISLRESPNDPLTRHALGHTLNKLHKYEPALNILTPLLKSKDLRTLEMTIPIVMACLGQLGRTLEAAELRGRFPRFFKK